MEKRFNAEAQERRFRMQFVRRAIETNAPLLAGALHRYAHAENLTWEALAHSLGGTVDGLNQVAICLPPRPEQFSADVAEIAGEYVDPDLLLSLLRRLQVLESLPAMAVESHSEYGSDPAASMLLAARDHEAAGGSPQEAGTAPNTEPNNHQPPHSEADHD